MLPPISLGGIHFEPSLPAPFVEYPQSYGALHRFSRQRGGPFSFCSCAREALRHVAELNIRYPRSNNSDPRRMALLDSLVVPSAAAEPTISWSIRDLDRIEFLEGVCHRCQRIPPTLRWCHEMYGDPWKQAFGWYVYSAAFECGVDPWRIERNLPEHVPKQVKVDLDEYVALYATLPPPAEVVARHARDPDLRATKRALQTRKSRVMRYFTSEARVAFGFKRVGEGWVSETMLFHLVQQLLSEERIIRHDRPDWLGGLELDIHIPALRVGIEYQGTQHSSPVEHWGGEEALTRQQERDARKRSLCKSNGVHLIEVFPDTPLTLSSIADLLSRSGIRSTAS